MAEVTLCGHDGCDKHLTEHDINHASRQTEAYQVRPFLCWLNFHPHSRLSADSCWRACVRCGHSWRVYDDL